MTVTATSPPRRAAGVAALASYALPLAIAAAVFFVAWNGGSYGLTARNALAICVWWAIALAVGLSLWPLARIPRAALLTGGLLVALAVLTALSIAWAPSAERAFNEFNRVGLYAGVFAVAVLAGSRANVDRWCDGIALGVVGVGGLALATRLFPDLVAVPDVDALLPGVAARLAYPLGYWNGLAAFVALGLPLLLRAATQARSPLVAGLALAPFPALAGVLYLTSSRGGIGAALIGCTAFLVLTSRRWGALGALAVAGAGAAVVVAVLLRSDALVNGPLGSAAARDEGRTVALAVVAACAGVALVSAAGARLLGPRVRPARPVGWAVAALLAAVAVAGIAAVDPVDRARAFAQTPTEEDVAILDREDAIRAHLLSASGNGRWQWWGSAVDQFRANPATGGGAGSFEAWWTENGNLPTFVRDAHSVYAETLGELGPAGLLLLVGVFGTGLAAGLLRLARDDVLGAPAALVAGFLAYAFIAGIDWMWELTAVSVVAMLFLGLLTGPATAVVRPRRARHEAGESDRPNIRAAAAVALVAAAPFALGSQLVPLVSTLAIGDSQAAVERGDGDRALREALAARRLQSWAASTHLQVALVHEHLGRLGQAAAAVEEAIARDERDWRLWLVRARIETKQGRIPEARESLRRAAELNPRSPLFAGLGAG